MPRYVPGLLFGLAAFGLLRARGAENVSVDGKLVASIADSHYTAGRIGLASSQGLIRVKDIHLVGTPAKLQEPWRADPPPRLPVTGTGKEWTDHVQIYEYQGGSFGYTGVVEVQPGKLLYVHDRHDAFPEYDGKRTTAVQGVYITVEKK